MLTRSHYAAQVDSTMVGQAVTLAGWVHRRRDHGGLIFIDLRDRSGLIQVRVDPQQGQVFAIAEQLRPEYVVGIEGAVVKRPQGMDNPDMVSGAVEVVPRDLVIFSKAKTPPFEVDESAESVDELTRLKFRYVDLRRPRLMANFILRDKVLFAIRQFFHEHGFLDVETPALARSTPEGARDFLVPSRLQPGSFYALPQSPQIFKQLLMVGGFDRYYQIAKVFRDEDLRADRQPEFTQVDVEMSFMDREAILSLMELMLRHVFREALGVKLDAFPRMSWDTAMRQFGSDKPDLRAGDPLVDLTAVGHRLAWPVFTEAEAVVGVRWPNYQPTRKQLDQWMEAAKSAGAPGLIWIVRGAAGMRSSAAKLLGDEGLRALVEAAGIEVGDCLMVVAGPHPQAFQWAGQLRLEFARQEHRMQPGWRFLWVTDFPLFEWSETEQRWASAHHPFTMPVMDDLPWLTRDPGRVRSQAYDVVLNGVELASGSLRIYDPQLQAQMFAALGLKAEEIEQKFGYFIDAFHYGAPPHGGIAFGLDRLVMLMAQAKNLREVIAFPKTARGTDPLMEAPNTVDSRQLEELALAVVRRV